MMNDIIDFEDYSILNNNRLLHDELGLEDINPRRSTNGKKLYIMLFHAVNLVSKVLSTVQRSSYSHAGVSLYENVSPFVDNQMGNEFRFLTLDDISSEKDFQRGRKIDVYGYPLTEMQWKQADKLIKYYIKRYKDGKFKYDTGKLIDILLRKNTIRGNIPEKEIKQYFDNSKLQSYDNFICSSFVLNVLIQVSPRAKKWVEEFNLRWDTFTPSDFLKIPYLEPEYRWSVKNGREDIPREFFLTEKHNLDISLKGLYK